MEYPVCGRKEQVESDPHAESFAGNLQECKAVWTVGEDKTCENLPLHGATSDEPD